MRSSSVSEQPVRSEFDNCSPLDHRLAGQDRNQQAVCEPTSQENP
jgi:hypothetical protein